MPYSYHESTTLSHENAVALKSLSTTGELPKDHYWNALRAKHDANPTKFDKGNVVLAALLDRDQLQREGVLAANAPILPTTGFFAYAAGKHSLNITRFDHWHPFLGNLFQITLPTTTSTVPAGQGLTSTTTTGTITTTPVTTGTGGISTGTGPTSNLLPPSSGTLSGPGATGSGVITPRVDPVPEPASAVMLTVALALAVGFTLLSRKFRKPSPLVVAG